MVELFLKFKEIWLKQFVYFNHKEPQYVTTKEKNLPRQCQSRSI